MAIWVFAQTRKNILRPQKRNAICVWCVCLPYVIDLSYEIPAAKLLVLVRKTIYSLSSVLLL